MKNNIAARIKELRKHRGFTQKQLGEVLSVSAQAVSKWERAEACPDVMLLPALASVLGVSVDALLGCNE